MDAVYYIVSTMFIANAVLCHSSASFEKDSSLTGKVCPAERKVFESTEDSTTACAVASEERGSAAFVYVEGTSMCYGCDVMSMFKKGEMQDLQGAMFYRRDPAPAGYYYVAGDIMKIVTDPHLSYTNADSACAPYGQLVRIDTSGKLTAIKETLKANELLDLYWVQRRLGNDGVWRFDDGTPAPGIYQAHIYKLHVSDEPSDNCCLLNTLNLLLGIIDCGFTCAYICEAIGSL